MNFIIYGLPRSRTFWLSRFLTYGEWNCTHDEIIRLRGLDDLASWRSLPCQGSVETAAAPFWRLINKHPTVTIRRAPDAVIASLNATGLLYDQKILRDQIMKLDQKLNQIERRVPNTLSVQYDDLDEAGCRKIWEHCLPYPFDREWYETLAKMNLQINLRQQMRYFQAHRPQLEKLAVIAKYQMIKSLCGKPLSDIKDDGIIIESEPFATFYRDSQAMFADHLVRVGEAPDAFSTKNIEMMQLLEDHDCLQVMTARCNGRVFGYLMTTISPSLESPNVKAAIQNTFYASPLFKGLGQKLQRASIDLLRQRGITEVYFHAGVRGDGRRMGSLYRRIGAEAFGDVYKLTLSR